MLSTLTLNFFLAMAALSLSTGVALHSSRVDKAFATVVVRDSDTSIHDFSRSISGEMHIHSSHIASEATSNDPSTAAGAHKKHALHYARMKQASTTA